MANLYPAGIGNAAQAMQATAAMRQEPWYQQLLASWGLDPRGDANGNVSLNEDQQQQLLDQARAHGIGISDNYLIDQNGQIAEQPSHLWRDIGIGAGIGGLALTGLGAAGIGPLSGLLGGASSVASAIPATEGIGSAASLGLPVTAGLGTAGTAAGVGAAATPGLTDWLKTAQNVGGALSSASAGRAQGRIQEGLMNQNQARTAVDLYNTELNAPRTIARNAVKGDVLANAQDASFSGVPSTIPVPTISGGLRPSMFSDATRQTGRNISAAAAATPIPSPAAPVLPELPQAGGFDSFLNGASSLAGIASATSPLWRKYLHL